METASVVLVVTNLKTRAVRMTIKIFHGLLVALIIDIAISDAILEYTVED